MLTVFFHPEYLLRQLCLRQTQLRSRHSLVVNVAAQSRYGRRSKGPAMQTIETLTEPKVQALSWLVSQLRWEETLGDLRHDRDDEHAEARQAA